MASIHVCASGHHWQADIEQPTTCPVCTSISSDLLPPAPKGAEPLPTVPGYEVQELIGQGGMGVVFKAKQRGLERLVALKLLQLRFDQFGARREEVRTRFRNEAEAIARLSHPNVVAVYEIGEWQPVDHPPIPFLSLEYVAGGTLAQRLMTRPLDVQVAARLVETLARAVAAAHERGVVHRDLKPDNVLLTEDGTPKIADFGLVRFVDPGAEAGCSGPTEAGAILGTPAYMAPEQARPGLAPIGPATDIWALGAILYASLTGRPPFLAASTIETLTQVVEQEPVALARLNATVPRDLETIALKCLRKIPADRYTSAGELADDLERFRLGKPVRARPVGRLVHLWRWTRRNPALAGSLLGLIVTLMVGLTTVTVSWRAELTQRRQAQTALRQTRGLLAGVVDRIYDDMRLPEGAVDPYPPALANDMLARIDEFQTLLAEKGDERSAMELSRSETWRGLFLWAAGQPRNALDVLRAATRQQEECLAGSTDGELCDDLVRTWHALAMIQDRYGMRDECRRSLDRAALLLSESRETPANLVLRAGVRRDLGRQLIHEGKWSQGLESLQGAVAAWDRLLVDAPSIAWQAERALVLLEAADLLAQHGEELRALERYVEVQKLFTKLAQQAPADRRVSFGLFSAYRGMSDVLLRARPFLPRLVEKPDPQQAKILDQAAVCLAQAREVHTRLARQSSEQLTRDWLRAEIDHAIVLSRRLVGERKLAQATETLDRLAFQLDQIEKLQPGPYIAVERMRLETYRGVIHASSIFSRGRAKQHLARAIKAMNEIGDITSRGFVPRDLGETAYVLAAALRNVGQSAEAIPAAQQAICWQKKALASASWSRVLRKELSRSMYELGGEYRLVGKHAEAAAIARERAALWPGEADELHDVACELCMCAGVLAKLRKPMTPDDEKQRQAYLDDALVVLKKAVDAGLQGAESLRKDGDFTPLRNRVEFQKLVKEVEERDRGSTSPKR